MFLDRLHFGLEMDVFRLPSSVMEQCTMCHEIVSVSIIIKFVKELRYVVV